MNTSNKIKQDKGFALVTPLYVPKIRSVETSALFA